MPNPMGSGSQTLTYDLASRVTQAVNPTTGTETYAYTAANRRGKRTKDGVTDYFFHDPLGNLIGRWRLKQYTNAENNDTIWRWSAEEKFYYLGSRLLKAVDRLGSTVSHLPYGEERTATANDRVKFATYWRNGNTGLDYAWHRQYAAVYGRFTSPDPYQASGGPADPGSWNRYAYVVGDPVNRIDPMGLDYTLPTGSHFVTSDPRNVTGGNSSITVSDTGGPWIDAIAVAVRQMLQGGHQIGFQLLFQPVPTSPISCSTPTAPAGASVAANASAAHFASTVRELEASAALGGEPAGLGGELRIAAWFASQVRPGGEWDYKQQGSAFQDFGNFHYGVIGAALGYSQDVLLRAAGLVQHGTDGGNFVTALLRLRQPPQRIGRGWFLGRPPHGDDPVDQNMIKAGITAFNAWAGGLCVF